MHTSKRKTRAFQTWDEDDTGEMFADPTTGKTVRQMQKETQRAREPEQSPDFPDEGKLEG
ncbi:MAG: hypothetical protein ACR2NT_07885 [Acidimicrobiia bacterium]